MSKKILVILVVFGVLVGNIAHVPIARAVTNYSFGGPAYGNILDANHNASVWVSTAVGFGWTGYYGKYDAVSGYAIGDAGGNCYAGYTWEFYKDGVINTSCTPICDIVYVNASPYTIVDMRIRFVPASGSHAYSWYFSGTLHYPGVQQYNTITLVGSVAGYDITNYGYGYPGGSEYGPGVWPTLGPPLAVTIDSGPTAIDLVDGGTWHATATGGTPGYTYDWAYQLLAMGGYFTDWPNTGQSFTHIFPAGTWIIQVQATDSVGAHAYADITVTAATIAGSYQAHLTRSGSYGQYMSVYVTDAAGDFVTISSTASTQFGIYATSGGAFGWVAADNEAVQFSGYTWRWTMSADFGGATGPPPPDFWFQSSIHLAIPNLNLLVMHHFTGISETAAPWFPPGASGTTVTQVVPETTPVPTSTVPDWLVPLRNFFIEIFQYLFVPSSSAFSSQLASGWLLIDSPVPSITPQYTIPFPNPSHLLAPTGDSVNINFSGIQAYSGYSTYKTIVQVFLDAILVFIVISLVT
jgi:hypothetical protein